MLNQKQNVQLAPQNKLLRPEEGSAFFFFIIVSIVALQILLGVVVFMLIAADATPEGVMDVALIATIVMHLMLIALYFLLVARRRRILLWDIIHRPHNGEKKLSKGRYTAFIFIAIAIGLFGLPAFFIPTMWYGRLTEFIITFGQGINGSESPLPRLFEIVVFFILAVGLAPISEEFIFRGALLTGLRRQMSPIKAILLSSFAFMIFHMNPYQVFYQFILGVICGFAVLLSKKLIVGIVIHAASNLVAMMLMLFEYTHGYAFRNSFYNVINWLMVDNIGFGILIMLGLIIVFGGAIVGLLFLYHKLSAKDEPLPEIIEPVLIPKKVYDYNKACGIYNERGGKTNYPSYRPSNYPPPYPPPQGGYLPHYPPHYPNYPSQNSTGANPFFSPPNTANNPYIPQQQPLNPNLVDPFGKPLDPFAATEETLTSKPPLLQENIKICDGCGNKIRIKQGIVTNCSQCGNLVEGNPLTNNIAPLLDSDENGMVVDPILTKIRHQKRIRNGRIFFWIAIGICGLLWFGAFLLSCLEGCPYLLSEVPSSPPPPLPPDTYPPMI